MKYNKLDVVGVPYCNKQSIVSNKIEKREILNIELNKTGSKTITIIMMNPSKADSTCSDRTINKLITFFKKQVL
ncbi:hypothetical protein SINU_07450, partial [Sporolactobacillus inulinus CASD]